MIMSFSAQNNFLCLVFISRWSRVNDDVIGQPLANFDTPLEVCNTTFEDNVKTDMVDSKAPIKGILRPRSDSKRKAGLTISKSITS